MTLYEAIALPEVPDGTRWIDVPVEYHGELRYGLATRQMFVRNGVAMWACGPCGPAAFNLAMLRGECRVVDTQPELVGA